MRRTCRLVSFLFPSENAITITDGRRRFKIHLNDPYWIKYAFCGFEYEVEIEHILNAILDTHSVFLDCGANTGYWSIYAATKIPVAGNILAVEPIASTFDLLRANAKLNGNSFTPIQRAVFSISEKDLQLCALPGMHDSSTCVVGPSMSLRRGYIQTALTTTIDELFTKFCPRAAVSSVVIKLDVEGAEIEALKGGRQLISNGALIVYEDHGRDARCVTTEFVLNNLGLDVYLLRSGCDPVRIDRVKDLGQLKKSRTKGYNLMAAAKSSSILKLVFERINSRSSDQRLEESQYTMAEPTSVCKLPSSVR